MKPLLYLELRQFINSIKNTFRSPKRLIPALIVGAWLISMIIQSLLLFSGAAKQPGSLAMNEALKNVPIDLIKATAFLFISFGSLLMIYQAFTSSSLIFSVAHIDFLFPTPISRRMVLLFKLVKDYLKYGAYVAFFFIFIGMPVLSTLRINLFPYGLISIAALVGLLIFVVNIAHTINLLFTFGFERLKQAGVFIKAILLIALISIIGFGVYQYAETGDSFASILWAANSPLIKTVFAPADWCSTLFVAPLEGITHEDEFHLGMLWILAIISFVFLLSRRENIYEPSLGISMKVARRRKAMRSGDYAEVRIDSMIEKGKKSAGGFTIPSFGEGAAALLWKSMLIRCRVLKNQLVLVLIVPPLLAFMLQRFITSDSILRNIPYVLWYITFVLSMTAQAEVRSELKHANILKSMPITAWKVMLVQALSGAVYIGAGVLVFSLSMWIFIPLVRTSLLLITALSSPFIGFACVAATLIPSLLYPDMHDSAQNYFCWMIGMLLVSIALIPTIVLGVVLLGIIGVSYYVALPAVCLANVIVGASAVSIAGSIFKKFDPTSE